MKCPRCGAANPANKHFCGDCGAPLPQRCLTCGSENSPETEYCVACGCNLRVSTSWHDHGKHALAATGAERRLLTVAFCDLVGSTALSVRLDPEDLRDVIAVFHRCVSETVARYDGFIARYIGDGVLVYFGYPYAHEDDAERAVSAGLALVEAVGGLKCALIDEPIQVRVGISTGGVVVGDLIGAGAAQEYAVVGEAPNRAARLQALAEPNAVVICADTRRLTAGLFEYRDVGPVQLKGFPEPLQAWHVVRPSSVESRFEAFRSTPLMPLVGRDEELEMLLRRWRQAAQGEGRVVLLTGEPGIGKSRLTVALQEQLRGEAYANIRYFCSRDRQDSALFPVVSHLERVAGFARDDTPERKLDKLASLLVSAGSAAVDISLIAELMLLPVGQRYPSLDLSPHRRKERTLRALFHQLEGLARRQPVLVTFEDLQWIDPTSHEMLDLLVKRIGRLSVLLVATCRPEFQSPWTDLPQVTLVTLNRLGRSDGAELVRQLARNAERFPHGLVSEIVERADGVPLFVEELTKTLLEAGADRRVEMSTFVSASSLAIPATLHASLMARLDRLGVDAKQVAQIGAAIGREFSYTLLATSGRLPESQIQYGLRLLMGAGLVFQRSAPPHTNFLFKHALVQDIAYGTLLRQARQELHARIGRALEEHFPERSAAEPDLLAHHFANASMAQKAADYFLRAGQLAVQRSALVEAIRFLERGLQVLEKAPRDVDRLRQELDLQLALAAARSAAMGYAAHEVIEAYAKARNLCQVLSDPKKLYTALVGQYGYQFIRVERGAALRTAEEILQLAQGRNHREASILLGMSLYQLGKLEPAEFHVRQSLAPGKSLADQPPKSRSILSILDGQVNASMFHSMLLYQLGYLDHAEAQKRAALARARSLSHPYTLAFALAMVCNAHWFCDDAAVLSDYARELVTISAEHGYSLFLPFGLVHLGRAMVQEGHAAEGIAEMEKGIASYRGTGASWTMPYQLGLLACSYGESAQAERGLYVVGEALRMVQQTDERWFEPELHRIKGELYASLSREAEAEAAFREATKIAQGQRAKLSELRACVSHAGLWVRQGKREVARELLGPVYASFSEGLETRQLKEAKALLDGLAGPSPEATCAA
jgi:class 3 adenylate cyclase/predicted ATPase